MSTVFLVVSREYRLVCINRDVIVMSEVKKVGKTDLIGQKLAISVISILFAATLFGWILTEIFPPDFTARMAEYSSKWGALAVRVASILKLYDPFHSFWYTAVLLLFFVVLFLCMATRWSSFISKTFRTSAPAPFDKVPSGKTRADIRFADPMDSPETMKDPVAHFARRYGDERVGEKQVGALLQAISDTFRKRGYRFASARDGEKVFISAETGRWRYMGNLLFHIGLLLITAGGMIGSRLGRSELLYGKPGDIIPLYRNTHSVRIDDFSIILGSGEQVSDYISRLSIVDENGVVVQTRDIEVNSPMRFGGFNIYQSAYYVEDEFLRAKFRYTGPEKAGSISFIAGPGQRIRISGTPYELVTGNFYPDFRMGRNGPWSASPRMVNPALQVRLVSSADSLSGYLFLKYPRFNTRFSPAVELLLEDIEPVYYTGLEISTSPGAWLMMAGMALSAIGLVLLYSFNYRRVRGVLDREKLVIYAAKGRWAVSFGEEFGKIEKQLRRDIGGLLGPGA